MTAEREPRIEWEGVAKLSNRWRRATWRRLDFLDIAQGATNGQETGTFEGRLRVPAGEAMAFFAQTRIGALFLPANSPIMSAQMVGLLRDGELGMPTIKKTPDKVFWRTTVTDPENHRSPYQWARSIGVVMHHKYDNDRGQTVTAESEVGIVIGYNAQQYFRAECVYINGELVLVGPCDLFPTYAEDIDEFTANIKSQMLPEANPASFNERAEYYDDDENGFAE